MMSQKVRRSMKDWEKIVNTQQSSGQSARSFCEENGIGLASFYKWRGRFQKESSGGADRPSSNGFVEVGAMRSSRMAPAESNWRVSVDLGDIRLTLERG